MTTNRTTTGAPCQHGQAPSEAFGSASPVGTSAADAPGVETGLGAPVVPDEIPELPPLELPEDDGGQSVRAAGEYRERARQALRDHVRTHR